MGNFKEEIGKKLLARRKAKGFKTQGSLAAKIPGVDRTRISRWESGENLPDPIYREKLTSLLDLPDGFFDEIAEPIDSDRPSLILEIQDLLKILSQDDLETLKASAENMAELSQIKTKKNQAD